LENNEVKKYPVKIIFSWSMVVIWMAVIFAFSHQSSEVSGGISLNASRFILQLFDKSADAAAVSLAESIIRNFAHGFVFFVLGIFVSYAFESVGISEFANAGLTFLVSAIYAVSDEVHQIFIPGRAGQLSDFLIDALGIIIAIIAYQIFKTVMDLRAELAVKRQEDLRL
jgi:VanZ family protein